jgi:hypothetical protein
MIWAETTSVDEDLIDPATAAAKLSEVWALAFSLSRWRSCLAPAAGTI